jgi:hypothetical protein
LAAALPKLDIRVNQSYMGAAWDWMFVIGSYLVQRSESAHSRHSTTSAHSVRLVAVLLLCPRCVCNGRACSPTSSPHPRTSPETVKAGYLFCQIQVESDTFPKALLLRLPIASVAPSSSGPYSLQATQVHQQKIIFFFLGC